ncbi:MAG: porin [Pseudomonadota bacterium]
MKKVLLASTALVLSAGYAAAEVSVSGEANAGLKYSDGATDETQLHYELDFAISGSGSSDSGLEFGASFDLDLDDSTESDSIDDPEVFISGSFGTITVGGVDDASDNVGLGFSDIGFDGIGIDDEAETFIAAGDADILYEYAINSLTFVASASLADSDDSSTDDYAVGFSYGFGDFEVQLAYSMVDSGAAVVGDGADIIYVGFEGGAGAISYDLFYHQADGDLGDVAGYGGSVDFSTGAITWTVAAGATDVDDDDADFGVGMEYDLGGGLAFGAGVGSVSPLSGGDSTTVAEAGFTMSF